MLKAVRNLIGNTTKPPDTTSDTKPPELDRAALDEPVAAARKKLEQATVEHQAAQDRSAELSLAFDAAQLAFDVDGSDQNADAIAAVKRDQERHSLFVARTQRAVVAADSALVEAIKARDAGLLRHYEDRRDGAERRIVSLWQAKGKPALLAFAAFVSDVDNLVADAQAAAFEISRIHGERSDLRSLGAHAMVAYLRALVSRRAESELGVRELDRIVRFLGT